MPFGPDHYVPVLKVKRGEKKALRLIPPILQSRMTPLLEIVQRQPDKTLDAHLDTAFADLAETLRTYSRCFLDTHEIAGEGQAGAVEVFQRASGAGIVFTPVTGLSRTSDVAAALSHRENGLALRISRGELEQGELATRISVFLIENGLTTREVDLIIDLGTVEDLIVEGIEALMDEFMAEVPDHSGWNTLTVSACAFPKSMGVIERNSHALTERSEWLAWKEHLYNRRQYLARLPSFSDCAIQYPAGVEGFDPRIMAVSASVRYTLETEWLLIKGQSTKSIRAGIQFPGLAHELVYGSFRSHFYGTQHCKGCELMKAAADGVPSLGSAEVWRQLGTIHHLSVVTQAVVSLPWP